MNTAKLTLQEVAARLEAVLPPYTAETQPVTAKLYRLLAEGQPVSRQRIITSLALRSVWTTCYTSSGHASRMTTPDRSLPLVACRYNPRRTGLR